MRRTAVLDYEAGQPHRIVNAKVLRKIVKDIELDSSEVLTTSAEGVRLDGSSLQNALKKCQPWQAHQVVRAQIENAQGRR